MKTTIALASILGVGLAAGGATLLRDRTVSTPKTITTHPVAFPELKAAALSASSAIAQETPGCLRVSSTQTICPLRHTDVKANISGMVARVTVTQLFEGPKNGGPVEAVYSFPLPENAAVDDMTIKIGKDRIIQGSIKRREEARNIYNSARAAGQTAALLDQERANLFTQSIANLMPGQQVAVQISYVQTLKYEDGHYEFVHPLVVGPRYGGVADNQPLGVRSGHDVSVQVNLDAGLPLGELAAQLHDVGVQRLGETRAQLVLSPADSIPNKDFILRWTAAGSELQEGLLAQPDGKGGGHFLLMLQPPSQPRRADVTPKELVFVIDQTGSQAGEPLEKAKETMRHCIQNLNPGDTFQLLGFNTAVYPCFPKAVPATRENIQKALAYLQPLVGSGGTDILQAANYALQQPDDPDRLRIICYMTDGLVGNDREIVGFIRNHRGTTRMFPFGIGNSVNRFLIEGMAREGRGVADIVDLRQPGDVVAKKFQRRIADPLLTNISVDWGGLPVAKDDIYPRNIPDVFSAAPIVLKGRYTKPGDGDITVHGVLRGKPWERRVRIHLSASGEPGVGEAIPTLWAREKIEDRMHAVWAGDLGAAPKEEIIPLALEHRLMTEYTSFVAVDPSLSNPGGQQSSVTVPTELPKGMALDMNRSNLRYQAGGFGGSANANYAFAKGAAMLSRPTAAAASAAAPTPVAESKKSVTAPPPSLAKLSGSLQKKAQLGGKERVKVALTLQQLKPDTLTRLQRLGFVLTKRQSTQVWLGTITADQLVALAQLEVLQSAAEPR
ncbi:MAG: VIT and VWA domain-containing protein [Armatimonadetes bacterium]|nr:VIT and VWA domain-containing protein [Armatimonadota bacterium]